MAGYTITTDLDLAPDGATRMADGRPVAARAYVTGIVPAVPAPEPARTRRGVDPSLDAAWDAHNTSVIAAQRTILDRVLRALNGGIEHGITGEFSRLAGCRACPCTPGWLLSAPVPLAGDVVARTLVIQA